MAQASLLGREGAALSSQEGREPLAASGVWLALNGNFYLFSLIPVNQRQGRRKRRVCVSPDGFQLPALQGGGRGKKHCLWAWTEKTSLSLVWRVPP